MHIKGSHTPLIDFTHNSNTTKDSTACPSTTGRSIGNADEMHTSFLGGPSDLSFLLSFGYHVLVDIWNNQVHIEISIHLLMSIVRKCRNV
ncbi:hypothetical protein Sjap_026166 [Stephania japonica]|uniref:Uncharacterized protein n=1 Tax=Stephania japonica TaxID=461633 RepID=A0AAP0HK72_9MAGN